MNDYEFPIGTKFRIGNVQFTVSGEPMEGPQATTECTVSLDGIACVNGMTYRSFLFLEGTYSEEALEITDIDLPEPEYIPGRAYRSSYGTVYVRAFVSPSGNVEKPGWYAGNGWHQETVPARPLTEVK